MASQDWASNYRDYFQSLSPAEQRKIIDKLIKEILSDPVQLANLKKVREQRANDLAKKRKRQYEARRKRKK